MLFTFILGNVEICQSYDRMKKSYRWAARYVNLYPNYLLDIVLDNVIFMIGGLSATLIAIACIYDYMIANLEVCFLLLLIFYLDSKTHDQ